MFAGCKNIKKINFISFDTKFMRDMKFMFYKCENLKYINLINFNTSNVRRMSSFFEGCESLTSIKLGNNFDTKNVEYMANMFKKCKNLKLNNTKPQKVTNLLHSFEIIQKINEYTKDKNVTFTSEVGQHQVCAVKNLDTYKDRQIFVSGGSGTMGFGFPAAIGAAVANPDKTIICITGDGSFQMGLHELATCKDYNLNIKILVLNNGYLGMVRQLQEKFCNGNYSETKISNPDFVKLANSYGIEAQRVLNSDEIDRTLDNAFKTQGPYLIDFVIESMETV